MSHLRRWRWEAFLKITYMNCAWFLKKSFWKLQIFLYVTQITIASFNDFLSYLDFWSSFIMGNLNSGILFFLLVEQITSSSSSFTKAIEWYQIIPLQMNTLHIVLLLSLKYNHPCLHNFLVYFKCPICL